MSIDKDLPRKEFFEEYGIDLLTLIFKVTYYGKDI